MTRDDIIRLALEHFGAVLKPSDLEVKLAVLAVAAEREACAKVCDVRTLKNEQACDGADADETISLRSAAWQISVCAAAIRARGKA